MFVRTIAAASLSAIERGHCVSEVVAQFLDCLNRVKTVNRVALFRHPIAACDDCVAEKYSNQSAISSFNEIFERHT